MMSPFILLLAYCHLLFNPHEAIAATASNNNLRRHQQQPQDSESRQLSASTTTARCIDQWHISIENPASCTNSHVFPPEWAAVTVRDFIFHHTPDECCQDVIQVAGDCNVVNTCDASMNYYDGAVQETDEVYFDMANCILTTWHMSTEILYACTNDGVYPDDWNSEEKRGEHLFSSAVECCERSYPLQNCDVINACPTPPPTPPPTPRPVRTRKPRPSSKPTQKPTPTPEPTPHPTTPPPDWYVDRGISKCVMDCINEPRRPCGGKNPGWEQSFPTSEECCASINWIDASKCVATAPPTKMPSLQEDAVVSLQPTHRFDWYKNPSTNSCVQDCQNEPGYPCGGLAGQWATRYSSAEECCATVPWKPFDECQKTAAPVTASPTMSIPPSKSPTPTSFADMLGATPRPTKRGERTDRPTSSPTDKPTYDCPLDSYWFLFKNGRTATCVNDPTYADDILDPSMKSYLEFDSSEQCCESPFAGDDCNVIDVCNPVITWYGEYSGGWNGGYCINNNQAPIPKGRRTFDSQLECCLDAFLGQSSEACLSFLSSGEA